MLSIRKAGINDTEILVSLGSETFYDTFRPFNSEDDMQAYISKAYHPDVIKQNLQNPEIAYYLCEDGDVPVGYIKLIANNSYSGLEGKTIELEKIYVLKQYFGKDAGQLLMDKAIEHAIQKNFHYLFLGVWKENSRAVKFYEKNGFEIFSERSFQLGKRLCEDYMMRKKLS